MTEAEKQTLIDAGYVVKKYEGTWQTDWWAITPEGNSIFRGPASNEEDAWRGCQQDFDRRINA